MKEKQISLSRLPHTDRLDGRAFLSLSHLSVGYRQTAVLQDFNLSAGKCELVALIGRNGSGKSTLMRTIARLQPAVSGKIQIAGNPLNAYSRSEMAELLSIVSTEPVGVSHLTVGQLVSFGRFPHTNWIGKLTPQDIAIVEESMQLVGMAPFADKRLAAISDGERQRAMIARTLAQDTALILLDEPTAFLDMPNKYEVVRLLHRLTRNKRKTIIFSTHDLNIAMQEADKLWLIVDGRIYEGAPEDLVLNRLLNRIFDGSTLHFDDGKGEFQIKRTDTHPIKLTGCGKSYFWTQKALERMGYRVNECRDSHRRMAEIIVSDGQKPQWIFKYDENILQFDTIYDLSQYILKNSHLINIF